MLRVGGRLSNVNSNSLSAVITAPLGTRITTTPLNEAAVLCDTLNMLGAFRDSYQQLLAVPTDLLNTPAPLPDWRDVLQAADTVTEADIRNVYPGSADAAVAVFQRPRRNPRRGVSLSSRGTPAEV